MSLRRDLTTLSKELQFAAAAAIALVLSLVLPWYQKSVVLQGKITQANLSAFGVFTFVEAAVLLVAVAVLFLVWARSQRKGFHLPGGDGAAITLAGGWALLLLVWRLFDKPGIQGQGAGATVGIQWGIFGALVAAGALVVAGARVRAAHRPEPPNPAADEVEWVAPARPDRVREPDRRPRDARSVTDVLRDRPAWEGDAPDPSRPRRSDDAAPTTRLPDDAARTSRFGDDAAPTTRLPGSGEPKRPADPDDPSRARTTRLPEPPRRRATDDPSRDETQRLFDDDPPG